MRLFRATVTASGRVTPRMHRVTIAGDELRAYAGSRRPDESCRVLLPEPGEREPVVADGPTPRLARSYTIRRCDRDLGEIDLDFVVHDGGLASDWAVRAAPGDPVVITASPAGLYEPPSDTSWLLLAGDATALPAIARIVEEGPPGVPIEVRCVVTDPAEHQDVTAGRDDVSVTWVHAAPRDMPSELEKLVLGSDLSAEPGYVWVAGEASATRAIRRHLRHTLALPAQRYDTVGYWRLDAERWQARYDQVAAAIEPRVEAAETIADDEEYFDVVDAIYDEAGL